jgi:hypothetical protein
MTIREHERPAAVPGRKRKPKKPDPGAEALANEDPSDFLWGAAAIGREIGRTEKQVFHLVYGGALDGAVRGHVVGSRARLRALFGRLNEICSPGKARPRPPIAR